VVDLAGVLVAIAVACALWYVRKRRGVTGPELSWLYDALNVITVEILAFLTVATFTPSTPWLVHAIAGASQLLPIVFVYCAGLIVRQMLKSTRPAAEASTSAD
jgi:hypothetical protein